LRYHIPRRRREEHFLEKGASAPPQVFLLMTRRITSKFRAVTAKTKTKNFGLGDLCRYCSHFEFKVVTGHSARFSGPRR
jgi:hypothetical protein